PGNDYLGLPAVARIAYVLGFRHGITAGVLTASDPASIDNITKCVESSFTNGQLAAVLDKNLADHPDTRNRGLPVLMIGARPHMQERTWGEHALTGYPGTDGPGIPPVPL